ncbi:MAG TPA: zf-HC2 domain-containing protein [Candidatus Dormibacteraeota bacterium]|nr:zf-HC2 domain-containing protein [Candidatus Dormibacteraeota bacterium]
MKCRDVVELMTDYLEGALSPHDRARFEDHIAGCDGCRAYLEQLRETRKVAGRLASEPLPHSLQAELLNAFRDWRAGKKSL